jgi:hypothetical protein
MPKFDIDYTALDYDSLLAFLDDSAKKLIPEWTNRSPTDVNWALLQLVAGIVEIANFYTNFAYNESVPSTVRTRSGFYRLAKSRGFFPKLRQSAVLTMQVERSDDTDPYTVLEGSKVTAIDGREYFVLDRVTYGAGEALKEIVAFYGQFLRVDIATPSDGSAWQEFRVAQDRIITGTLRVWVDSGSGYEWWKPVDSLALSSATDKEVMYQIEEDGTVSFLFGDGVNGAIPPLNANIRYTVGIQPAQSEEEDYGNIGENSIASIDGLPTSFIVHPAATAGASPPTLSDLVRDLALFESSSQRAVSLRDYEFLARQVNGVNFAKAEVGGLNLTLLYCFDIAGNAPPLYTRQAVEAYVGKRLIEGKLVNVRIPSDLPVNLGVEFKLNANVSRDTAQTLLNSRITALFKYLRSNFVKDVEIMTVYAFFYQTLSQYGRITITELNNGSFFGANNFSLQPSQIVSQGTVSTSLIGGV